MRDPATDAPQGGTAGVSAGGGWRGRRSGQQELARHRWQQPQPTQPSPLQVHKRRLKTTAWLLLGLGLFAWFVSLLLLTPVQTPLIVLAAGPYASPFPPNAWAWEDIEGLRALDHESLQVLGAGTPCRTREQTLRHLERHLQTLARGGWRSGTLILYVSMHGGTDGNGRPCLLPPGASPLNSDTWLPVSELLARIKAAEPPPGLHKLLILDCNRIDSQWNLGLLENGLADRLQEVVAHADIANLAVLNSAAAGQRSWASSDLEGSAFGHFLRRGLAGAADAVAEGGNGDRRVSLHELTHYLEHHVGRWVQHNRGTRQRPLLVPHDAADFPVAWALRSRRATAAPRPAETAETLPVDMERPWREYERLDALSPERHDPLTWREFQQKLWWLEQAAAAGQGYRSAALRVSHELPLLAKKLHPPHRMDFPVRPSGDAPSLKDGLGSPSYDSIGHTLPLAESLGTLDPARVGELKTALAQFRQAPSEEGLQLALEEFERIAAGAPLSPLVEVHFLHLLRQPPAQLVWSQPDGLRRALQVRDLAEAAAVPADERTQYWIRGLMSAGDGVRRLAEDRLFVGEADGTAEWDAAAKHYADARTRAQTAAQALNVSNRVWTELPWLAQWVVRPHNGLLHDEELDQRLLGLIAEAHELTALLAQLPAAEAEAAPLPFVAQSEDVERRFEEFRRNYDDQCARLLESRLPSVETLRALETVLSVPLLPRSPDSAARQRAKLRLLSHEMAAELHGRFASSPAGPRSAAGNGEPNDPAAPEEPEHTLLHWEEHPALAILNRELWKATAPPADEAEPAGDRVLVAARKGQAVRELLARIPAAVRETGRSEPAPSADLAAAARSGWSQAERLVRTTAVFAFRTPDDDPVARLRQIDRQQLLFWHADRILDDFLGPGSAGEPSFFETAAADCLQAARVVLEPGRIAQRQLEGLHQRLERRRQGARDGLQLAADNLVLIDAEGELNARVVVSSGRAAAEQDLPPGEAAVLLGDRQGLLVGGVGASPVPPRDDAALSAATLTYPLRGADLAGRGPEMQATAWYRGHLFAAPFLLNAAGGPRVDFTPHVYETTRITLNGGQRKRPAIVFVLDCSGSMHEAVTREGAVGRHSRLDAARNALNGMLEELARQRGARVGVVLFGHRVGWSTTEPNALLHQHDYAVPIPDDLKPYEDVEVVLPLGRFDDTWAGHVADRLETVKPWGETPLYLSLIEALRQFSPEDDDTEKSIVVITDGVNYQFNPSPEKSRSLGDVLTAWNARRVPVHVIGFGIAPREQAAAQTAYRQLADATRGSYRPVAEATALVAALRERLGPGRYRVSDTAGGRTEANVGATLPIVPSPDRRRNYSVSLDSLSATVELAGGEALELAVSADGQRIESLPYLTRSPRFAPLVSGTPPAPTGWQFGMHRPVWRNGGVRFEVSLQHEDRRVLPRPDEVWLEITPVLPEGEGPAASYLFYDANYEPGTPVPVLRWTAEDWPTQAAQARLRFWCKSQQTPPTRRIPLREVLPAGRTAGELELAELPGVTCQVRARQKDEYYQIDIIERHPPDSPDVFSLKVELEQTPRPLRIIRRFDATHGVVMHTYLFDRTHPPSLDQAALRLTTRHTLHTAARRLDAPLLIEITDSGDLLRLPHRQP